MARRPFSYIMKSAKGLPLSQINGRPVWVPDNAKIHIDFVNDRAWTAASGVVAIETLLGTDPDASAVTGGTAYDPAELTADGLVHGEVQPAFIGAAKSLLASGATSVFRFKQVSEEGSFNAYLMWSDVAGENIVFLQ